MQTTNANYYKAEVIKLGEVLIAWLHLPRSTFHLCLSACLLTGLLKKLLNKS